MESREASWQDLNNFLNKKNEELENILSNTKLDYMLEKNKIEE
jgi:hypothetical protein